MSISEKSASVHNLPFTSRDVDPLLKDLNDKKQNFRRNVVSLAGELKELRNRLASQEQSYVKESLTRQVQRFPGIWVFCLFVSLQSIILFFLFLFLAMLEKL